MCSYLSKAKPPYYNTDIPVDEEAMTEFYLYKHRLSFHIWSYLTISDNWTLLAGVKESEEN